MRLFLTVAFLAFVHSQSVSVPANILDQYETEVSDYNKKLSTVKDNMIIIFLNRTLLHMQVYQMLKTNVVKPLMGFSRFRAVKINSRYKTMNEQMSNFFQEPVLRDVLDADFTLITSYINNDLRMKVSNFTALNIDSEIMQNCWDLSKPNITIFFDNVDARLSEILTVAPSTLDSELDVLEVTMKEAFNEHQKTLAFCKKKYQILPCIKNYVTN